MYLDDILTFSKDEEEHETHLRTIFATLQADNLRVNLPKCEFFQEELTFLGFSVSSRGLRAPRNKKSEIMKYALPQNGPTLKSFIGMMSFYRRLIRNFANIMHPLTEKLRLNPRCKSYLWSPEEEVAFTEIKKQLQEATLPYSHPEATHLQLVTDSSQGAIGAALHQKIEAETIPVEFYSQKLTEAQQKYSTFDRELLAAYSAVIRFKEFLEGRNVILCTDYKPLVSAFL